MNKPSGVDYEPVACPSCFADFRTARQLWMDSQRLVLVCEVHGDVMTAQHLDAVIHGKA